MESGHIDNRYDIPEHGIACEVVYSGALGPAWRAIGPIAQAYGWCHGARVLRVVAAHEAPPIERVPPGELEPLILGAPGVCHERWLVWYDYGRGAEEREAHGALVDALIRDHGISGEVAS